jgi:hypothetical protein
MTQPLSLMPTLAVAAALCVLSHQASDAAPITFNLEGRLTRICNLVAGDVECTPQNVRGLPISFTYDPDTIAFNDVIVGWQIFVSSAGVTLPFAPLPSPFSGPTNIESFGSGFFSNIGLGFEERGIAFFTSEQFREDVCGPDGHCGYNEWRTSAAVDYYQAGTPPFLSPPTAADVQAHLLSGLGGSFSLETRILQYDPDAHLVRLVGYQAYQGNIPEPTAVVMLGIGTLASSFAARRRRLRGASRFHPR